MNTPCNSATLQHQFNEQRLAFEVEIYPSLTIRRERINRLRAMLLTGRTVLAKAIEADFGQRSSLETDLIDIFPTLGTIDYVRRHLKAWMRPEKRRTNILFRPARSHIFYRPVGVVGIIAPWNFPVILSLGPAAFALAAGNRVMVKVSELTPNFSSVIARMVAENFSPNEFHVVTGDATVARDFSELPLDHLLFTGSTSVGRLVMQAAAKNLTPVTLELGGKCPAIIHPEYDLAHAVQRILHGKCINAGQTCAAPDYAAMVHVDAMEKFVECAKETVSRFFPNLKHSPDYASIINQHHYQRLTGNLEEAASAGARIVQLHAEGESLHDVRKIAPTLVLNAPDHIRLMQDEIFGPILPVVAYRTIDEAIAYVRARPQPLSAYYFDRNTQRIARAVRELPVGGLTINDTILHTCQDDLPFGGVGPSGMGRIHGREGFLAFSTAASVLTQSRFNGLKYFLPPYGRIVQGFLKAMLR